MPLRAFFGEIVPAGSRLIVPRAFVFDALHAFAQALPEAAKTGGGDWVCPACGQQVPLNFDMCWSCQSHRPE